MTTRNDENPPNYFRITLQSALAAGFFLGIPAGLLLWLILLQETSLSAGIKPVVVVLQAHAWNKIILLAICSVGWSFSSGGSADTAPGRKSDSPP